MNTTDIVPAIMGMGSAVPPYQIDQAHLCNELVAALHDQPALGRWLRALYRLSGIETRYSCLLDAARAPGASRFAPTRRCDEAPTTAERMAIYEREVVEIGVQAATRALTDYAAGAGLSLATATAQITHLITVSCTGFFAPGLDVAITKRLGLRVDLQRTHIGFMGCSAAFNATRAAADIVGAHPDAKVLVVCAELCTIHAQPALDRVNLTVMSLFADGAAACVVANGSAGTGECMLLDTYHTCVVAGTDDAMRWRIGDHGFQMHLSPQIPRLLGQIVPDAVADLLAGRPRPDHWAIHPGGPGIVDQVGAALDLSRAQTEPSWQTLRTYGNMSSATILFVLQELRDRLRARRSDVPAPLVAMAFGPGLVAELAYLCYVPARAPAPGSILAGGNSVAVA